MFKDTVVKYVSLISEDKRQYNEENKMTPFDCIYYDNENELNLSPFITTSINGDKQLSYNNMFILLKDIMTEDELNEIEKRADERYKMFKEKIEKQKK